MGTTVAFADVDKKRFAFAAYGTVDYLITPYVSIGVEVQKGELAGGDIILEKDNKQFINSYISGTVNLKFAIGELFSATQLNNEFLYNIRGLYAGAGFGLIKNKLSNVRYYGENFYPGKDQSDEALIPLNFGINFYLPNKWGLTSFVINANAQTAIAIGGGLDGYGEPDTEHSDIYSFFSVGIKYNFGTIGLDRRR